jgi:hypothetical protein
MAVGASRAMATPNQLIENETARHHCRAVYAFAKL